MNIKSTMKKTLIFLFIFAVGISIGSFSFVSASSYRNQNLVPAPDFPKNESGETYGSALESTSPETEPDLIKAYGEDGTIGYVRSSDLNGVQPKTPEEALKQQEKESGDREISLYDVDGKKVIGKFKIHHGKVDEKTKKAD